MSPTGQYDVLVAGGGVAGVAAALEAARSGMKTALLEKTVFTGGLATAGLVLVYLPLCDGRGTQVTFGLAEELLRLSLRYGPGDVPACWRHRVHASVEPPQPLEKTSTHPRYSTIFSPASLVLALDGVLQQAGVDLWLDTLITSVLVQAGRVVGLEAHNKSGRGLFHAPCVIDATGDADVAYLAGAECAEAENWLSLWALETSLVAARKAAENKDGSPLLQLYALGGDNAGRNAPADIPRMKGTEARQVTRFILEGRRILREHYQREQAGSENGRKNIFPLTLPAMAQFRTTRRIVGPTTLLSGQHQRRAEDSIGLVADWRKAGEVWEIPYATLLAQPVRGLLAAGRCISSTEDAWEVTRVIPAAALTGQAAGLAATLAVRSGTTPDGLEIDRVQAGLREKGIPLYREDVGL